MRRAIYISFIIILTGAFSIAQDPQLTQFYAAPLYLAPSFAGTTNGSRVCINARDQWTAVPGAYVTGIASYDHYFPSMKSGVGLFALYDRAGSGRLSTTTFALQYSYEINLNRKWNMRPGLQFYFSQRAVDFSRMTFGDQVTLNGIASTSVEVFPLHSKTGYVDFAASMLAFSDRYWGGLTVDHLARPNESLTGVNSRIPMTYKFYGGGKFGLNGRLGKYDEESLTFAVLYKFQGKYDQLDLGVYWLRKPLVLGLWYRGLPLVKSYEKGYPNNDAVMLLVGYQLLDMKIAYSYDFTVSRLVTSTGGAHEISLSYEFLQDQQAKKKTRRVIVPCPKF